MTAARKILLLALGFLSAFLIIGQLVLGQLIHNGQSNLVTAHRHSGYMTVTFVIVYILSSLWFVVNLPTASRRKP